MKIAPVSTSCRILPPTPRIYSGLMKAGVPRRSPAAVRVTSGPRSSIYDHLGDPKDSRTFRFWPCGLRSISMRLDGLRSRFG